ncbi:peptidase M23 [Salipiger aestuarii]|uniref:Murein DD-endopeptidase MepM/ murein hydrolase activator NlpD n=1 Tax=Salipiger aestuarii TaxID=568098 RepID=A0A327Y4B1_9RHOB|nr:M23 family metallopeptidase [Salipiger aestuarii]EIE49710.1 peptidase M23B [Citreicella sp. 357]KAA8606597.1 peptidase M23 [Salipiger aestuarii]KAB2541260.1 peptidase M23 [Salipiger aestuarii]RAK15142.1 murein DD-endopeptidase MepM/ murein hydrolase activator NlpD [Salipiger aestuarii]
MTSTPRVFRLAAPLAIASALGACTEPLDYDMRGRMGGSVDTSQAALSAIAERPEPDERGLISYPNYQVAVARNGDTVTEVANRVGVPAGELARFNGRQPQDGLRDGEVLALPGRAPTPTTATTAPIQPAGSVDITTLASAAIDQSPATPARAPSPAPIQGGVEPIRHQVSRGETAYTIARLYNVTPRSLADWNGLDSDYAVREGQFLLIPVVQKAAPKVAATPVPGAGSPTPQPPSASHALPKDEPSVAASAAKATATPAKPVADIGQSKPTVSSAAMTMPVDGNIIRDYAKGKNEGIDIAAAAGTSVKAAASGTVAAITTNTENVQILVVRHPDDVLSIYTHVDGLSVVKGDAVSRGQTIGKVRSGDPSFLHFEVRKGFDSVDPMTFLR